MKKSLLILLVYLPLHFYGQSTTFSNPGNSTFVGPAGITTLTVQAWGAGGAGGGSTTNSDGARAGAGGGGGAFASATLTIPSGASLPIIVGAGGTGVLANNGNAGGFSTITGYTGLIYAAGGLGGAGNISGGTPLGGSGGTIAGSQGTTKIAGGNGGNGGTGSSDDDGTALSSGVGGVGANGGGAGGTPINTFLTTNNGNPGTAPGGGGSGSRTSFFFGTNRTGGAGGTGRIIISYTCPAYSLTGTVASAVNVCSGTSSEITLTGTALGLPVGLYSVSYEIQGIAQTSAPMNVTVAGTGSFIATGFTTVGSRFITITGLTSGSSAIASENCTSAINSNNFTTVTVNSSGTAPVALAGTGATCNQITANWQAVAGAAYYELDVSTVNTFATFVTGYNALNVGNVLTFNITGLGNATYYYRVRAFNGSCVSANSNTITYATAVVPGVPTGISTSGNSCKQFTLNWSTVATATSYTVERATNSGFTTGLVTFTGITGSPYIITGLTANTQYWYRIRSVSGCGSSANATGASPTITTLNAVPGNLTGLALGNIQCSQFNVTWNAVAGASGYEVERATNSGFTTGIVTFSTTALSYIITGLAANTNYWYRVRAINGCGNGNFTNGPGSVRTSNSNPLAPTSVSASNTTVYCTEFIVSWNASAGAIDYTVERSTNNSFPSTSATQTFTGITGTSYTFTGLTVATQYFYRVIARNGCGFSSPANGTPTSRTTSSLPGTPSISPTTSTICQTDGVTLTSSASSGNVWSTGETTQSIYVTAAGSYTVKAVNSGGCSSATSAAAVINIQGLPTATAGGSQTICSNGGSATVSGATASNGTIKWTFSGGAGILENDLTLTPKYTPAMGGPARTVILTMTVTSNNSCMPQIATATYTVNVTAAPTASISGSKSTCSNGSITLAAGEANAANGTILWTHDGAGTISNGTTLTPTYTAAAVDAGKQVTLTMAVTSLSSCAVSYVVTDIYPVVVFAENTAGTASSLPTICNHTLMPDITHTTTGATGIGLPINLPPGITAMWASDVITIGGRPTSSGTFNYSIPLTGGCGTANAIGTITVNSLPVTPVAGTIIQPSCVAPTGSIELTGLLSSPTLQIIQNGTSTQIYSAPGSNFTVPNLAPGTYTFAIQDGTNCPSLPTINIEIKAPDVNSWNGTSWSKGSPPIISDIIEFADNYQSTGDLSGCSCKVYAGKEVTINSGHTLFIDNAVTVESATGTKLIFENSASLIQKNNVTNTGNIIYKRTSKQIRQADYVYWSTPVNPQRLVDVSPLTLSDKYMSYSGTGWVVTNRNTNMVVGKGYIIRGPENYSNTARADYTASFIGVPNNGTIVTETLDSGKYYLLGNPYPSSLDADEFISNNTILEGTLYFWTHNTPVVLGGAYQYKADDYASYNLSGGTGVGTASPTGTSAPGNEPPNGKIAAGQGFFVGLSYTGTIEYNNDMRFGTSNNSQFFKPGKTSKTAAIEKHRLWLNMTNAEGAFKQALIGYIGGATNNYESRYDGISLNGNKYLDFYSVNSGKKLVIQGRSLPFSDVDIVPLGYKSTIAGDFIISIDHADGNLVNQSVYLEDKTTNSIHDLRSSNYTFRTAVGTFDDRFVLHYTNKSLGIVDLENVKQAVLVSVKDKVIKVTSTKEIITEVSIFDVTGKLLYSKKKINATELQVSNLQSGNQVLLVKTTLENGYIADTKTVF